MFPLESIFWLLIKSSVFLFKVIINCFVSSSSLVNGGSHFEGNVKFLTFSGAPLSFLSKTNFLFMSLISLFLDSINSETGSFLMSGMNNKPLLSKDFSASVNGLLERLNTVSWTLRFPTGMRGGGGTRA